MATARKTLVFGPAYLDRVVHVDRPLVDAAIGRVIDRSASGRWVESGAEGSGLRLEGLAEGDFAIETPADWPGPTGVVSVDDGQPSTNPARALRCLDWRDDLGGMGAGFARAFGGTLCHLIGDETDPVSERVLRLLDAAGIDRRSREVPGRRGEWTLLITSGPSGDKLAIGFREPTETNLPHPIDPDEPCDLLVAASMTNLRGESALKSHAARVRMFAPSLRNMRDESPRVSQFVRDIDILCCNRVEWETLDDREEVAWRLSILAVTDGPRGAEVRYTSPTGEAGHLAIPAFPRRQPPRDTNRAGEAFASTLVTTLLDAGWSPGVTEPTLIERAASRASAAAALVLDRLDFGFPSEREIDQAVTSGAV